MSFSLDLTNLMTYAAEIFNSLSPIVVIIGGITLGLALVVMVLSLIRSVARAKF